MMPMKRIAAMLMLTASVTLAQRPNAAGVGRPLLKPDSAWWVPLSSALLPGTGQMRLGQNRFVAYLAVEAYALLGWANATRDERRENDRYRALAWNVSRAFFEARRGEGDWDYYEAMQKYLESGVHNRGIGELRPEDDLSTYNGTVWLKAREVALWPNVNVEPSRTSNEYNVAISYYSKHAVPDELRWSWRNAQLEWDDYRQSIRRKNEANFDASHYLSVLAVNHLLSTIDAFITIRLRGGLGAPRGEYRLVGTLPIANVPGIGLQGRK
jgi:hypothetical protein